MHTYIHTYIICWEISMRRIVTNTSVRPSVQLRTYDYLDVNNSYICLGKYVVSTYVKSSVSCRRLQFLFVCRLSYRAFARRLLLLSCRCSYCYWCMFNEPTQSLLLRGQKNWHTLSRSPLHHHRLRHMNHTKNKNTQPVNCGECKRHCTLSPSVWVCMTPHLWRC